MPKRISALILPLAATALLAGSPAIGQNIFLNGDPPDPEEVLMEQLSVPYYALVDGSLTRAQRKQIQVPARALNEYRHIVTYSYFTGPGKIVTNVDDHTLYTSRKDRTYQRSNAGTDVLKNYIPIIIDKDRKLAGLFGKAYNAALDKWVLTLADKPLYRFTGDTKPGDTKGKGNGWDTVEVIG